MKKIICMLAVVFACATASAQENKEKKERPRFDRTEMMVKDYNLDSGQAAKVKELNEKYSDLFVMRGRGHGGPRGPRGNAPRTSEKKIDGQTGATAQQRPSRRPDGNGPGREEMEKRMKERREKMEAYNAELKKIMTKDQYAAYEKRTEEMRNRRPQFGK